MTLSTSTGSTTSGTVTSSNVTTTTSSGSGGNSSTTLSGTTLTSTATSAGGGTTTGADGGTTTSAGGATAAGSTGGTTSSSTTDGSSTTGVGGGEAEVRFVGRIDRSGGNGERFAWSGSGLLASFEGTALTVSLNDASENQFTVIIDGQPQPKLEAQSGTHDYVLASSLDAGPHTVELYRRTEASFGVTEFLGLDFGAGGMLLPPPPASARRIEVIGDSITCGYGNEGDSATCSFSADTENHYLTYGAIAARELDAELVTVAWSGKGVIYNYGDDKTDPLPALYDRTLPDDANSQWDFSLVPDAVVINLSTNDFSTDDDPSAAVFEQAYVEFLRHLRSKYPQAWIIGTVGPMLGDPDLSTARAGIAAAVGVLEQEGDTKVKAWEMSISNDAPGCDYHPSVDTHGAMADALVDELRATLGWQ